MLEGGGGRWEGGYMEQREQNKAGAYTNNDFFCTIGEIISNIFNNLKYERIIFYWDIADSLSHTHDMVSLFIVKFMSKKVGLISERLEVMCS